MGLVNSITRSDYVVRGPRVNYDAISDDSGVNDFMQPIRYLHIQFLKGITTSHMIVWYSRIIVMLNLTIRSVFKIKCYECKWETY